MTRAKSVRDTPLAPPVSLRIVMSNLNSDQVRRNVRITSAAPESMDQAYHRILDAGQFPSGHAVRAFLCPFFCPHECTYSPDFGPFFGSNTERLVSTQLGRTSSYPPTCRPSRPWRLCATRFCLLSPQHHKQSRAFRLASPLLGLLTRRSLPGSSDHPLAR
jgi:hypothetical protein